MAKNRSIDPGLQYLQEIGFDRIRGKYGLHDRFIKLFGATKASQIMDQRRKIPDGSLEFYEFKNSDPDISRSFSEAYDGDIIRKACNYISSHKKHFGKTILEVGCESGYMTGFLAKEFSEAKIVSIDRSSSAVDMARNRIQSMGIQNVEFRVASLSDISEQYDTVFCMRTLQENWDNEGAPFAGEPIISQIFQYCALTEDYSNKLKSCLNDNGSLCVFERVGHDPLMCGWMMGLCLLKCAPDLESYSEIQCEEVGEMNTFQAFVCHKGSEENPQRMVELWYKAIEIDPAGKSVLTGWNALNYLRGNAGRLIRGVRILNRDNEQVGRFAAFEDKDGEPVVYYFFAAGGQDIQLFTYAESARKEVLNHLQESIEANIKIGLRFEEIDPTDEQLEGNEIKSTFIHEEH